MLVQNVGKGCVKGKSLRLPELHVLLEVEIRVGIPRRALGVRRARGDQAARRALGDVNPLSAIDNVGREGAWEGVAHIQVAGQRGAAVSRLEDAEVGCELPGPRQIVIHISLERVGAIGGQQPA